tara:strand:- start:1541 stop:1801 length:261 start_codon:yes stop_codon:yes gene_type:complete
VVLYCVVVDVLALKLYNDDPELIGFQWERPSSHGSEGEVIGVNVKLILAQSTLPGDRRRIFYFKAESLRETNQNFQSYGAETLRYL